MASLRRLEALQSAGYCWESQSMAYDTMSHEVKSAWITKPSPPVRVVEQGLQRVDHKLGCNLGDFRASFHRATPRRASLAFALINIYDYDCLLPPHCCARLWEATTTAREICPADLASTTTTNRLKKAGGTEATPSTQAIRTTCHLTRPPWSSTPRATRTTTLPRSRGKASIRSLRWVG